MLFFLCKYLHDCISCTLKENYIQLFSTSMELFFWKVGHNFVIKVLWILADLANNLTQKALFVTEVEVMKEFLKSRYLQTFYL